jgi:hypothetical protein
MAPTVPSYFCIARVIVLIFSHHTVGTASSDKTQDSGIDVLVTSIFKNVMEDPTGIYVSRAYFRNCFAVVLDIQ